MKAKIPNKNNGCLLWHKWRLVKDTGYTKYWKCKDCDAGFVYQPDGAGYQPINTEWLCGKWNCGATDCCAPSMATTTASNEPVTIAVICADGRVEWLTTKEAAIEEIKSQSFYRPGTERRVTPCEQR